MQMTMGVLNKFGLDGTKEFHETYAKMIALEATLEEFEYLLAAETANPIGGESEKIFVERNTDRNKYCINKEILGIQTQSELLKAISQN